MYYLVELYEQGSFHPYKECRDKSSAKGHAQDALNFNGVNKTRILTEKGDVLHEYSR